jgi:hypothetical protein
MSSSTRSRALVVAAAAVALAVWAVARLLGVDLTVRIGQDPRGGRGRRRAGGHRARRAGGVDGARAAGPPAHRGQRAS